MNCWSAAAWGVADEEEGQISEVGMSAEDWVEAERKDQGEWNGACWMMSDALTNDDKRNKVSRDMIEIQNKYSGIDEHEDEDNLECFTCRDNIIQKGHATMMFVIRNANRMANRMMRSFSSAFSENGHLNKLQKAEKIWRGMKEKGKRHKNNRLESKKIENGKL